MTTHSSVLLPWWEEEVAEKNAPILSERTGAIFFDLSGCV
jgi:hypothetical protein